jgi:hypothetical protein
MSRGLSRSLLYVALGTLGTLKTTSGLFAQMPAGAERPASLERFLALDDPDPWQYRATRHLEARNEGLGKNAVMDVVTEGDANGFRYQIVSEEGSEYIRNRVFRQTLDTEKSMWASGAPTKAALTPENYTFQEAGTQADGSPTLVMRPLRKDVLLVDGKIFLSADDGDLIRLEGKLSKSPSFWTRQVQIKRWYKRFAGVRMPVALESTANVRIAGQSTFRMTYQYESVNGVRFQ